ncbi:hypothetical protein B0H66DRAFT_546416 [Apodospora peruviana]|uniref:Uncharacterized protein n=1 Tax=Apodospora peruviana TaxID=516989 RepID=A0AAE0IUE9_9PEZI|nr:hypothetical protein B0H66DRAFT_546416 [Apodospora peruviana]
MVAAAASSVYVVIRTKTPVVVVAEGSALVSEPVAAGAAATVPVNMTPLICVAGNWLGPASLWVLVLVATTVPGAVAAFS